MKQTLDIAADGSARLATHAEVAPLLRDYLSSLAEVSGSGGSAKDTPVFDPAAIRKDLAARRGVLVDSVTAPTSSSLEMVLEFDSLEDVVNAEELDRSGLVSLEDTGDATTLRLRFDRGTWGHLTALFPPLRSPVVQQLGPQGSGAVTEQDYLSMVRFAMGDEAPGLLRSSFITLTVHPEGEILSQTGGTRSGGAVVFRIPVLRVLVLDRPLEYSVTYRPGGR